MEMMKPNLKDLRELHRCADNLLAHHSVDGHDYSTLRHVSESILSLLDLCGATRDVLQQAKDQLQELHSAARRTLIAAGETDLEARVSAHNHRMKEAKKEVGKCLRALRGMYKRHKYVFDSDLSLVDSNLIVVVHVLREVRVAAVTIGEALLAFISAPVATVCPGGSLAARIAHRWFDKGEAGQAAVLLDAGAGGDHVKPLQELEVELECIMRRLIHTRVLLLNILNN